MKSPKETVLESKILRLLGEYPFAASLARLIFSDEETSHIQDYANVVSIRRLGFNDHGPVHMCHVAYNAIKALVILFLHDLGMSVGRECRERTSAMLALPIINRHLQVCAAVLMLTGAVWAGNPAINYWTDYQLEYGITDRLAFTVEQENWYDTDRFYLEETILMAKVKVFDWFSVAVGDRFVDEREVHDGKRQWRYENRPTLDLLFKHSYEGFTLDWRNRYEYRDKEGADREWMRFRNRLRLRTPWKWTVWKISPYVSEELYYEDRHGLAKDKRLNQMRSLVGLSMKPAEHVTISVFYLLMHKQSSDRGWQPIHVPGIELKLDF